MSSSIPIHENQPINQPLPSTQTSSYSNSYNKSANSCALWLSIIFLGLLVILALVLLMNNEVQKPLFEVDSIVVSPIHISSNNQITANWTIGLMVKNSNKQKSVVYEKFDVLVFYNSTEYLCNTTVESFRQGPNQENALILEPKAWFQGLGNSVGRAIADDRKDGFIKFDLKFKVDTRFSGAGKKRVIADVRCWKLKVGFSSDAANGTMVGGSQKCSVTGLSLDL